MKRVLLDAEDFDQLIRGKIVKQGDVEVALQDIGYAKMENLLDAAMGDFAESM